MGRHSDALDLLNDTLDWTTSKGGRLYLTARSHWFSAISELFDVEDCQRLLIRTLVRAEPFYWDEKLLDVLSFAAQTTPLDWRLTDPFLPAQNGFMYLGKPVKFPEGHGKFSCNIAHEMTGFAWRKRDLWIDLIFFANPTPSGYHHLTVLTARAMGHPIPKEMDGLTAPELAELEQHCMNLLRDRRAINRAGQPWVIASMKLGQTIKQTLDAMYETFDRNNIELCIERTDDYCEECTSLYWRVFATALQFMNQRITVPVRTNPDRAVLRRVKDKPEWKQVQVVQLRRVQSQKHPSDIESQPVDWSCHWLVGSASGGFWRKQWHPSTKTYVPRWIMPYVKGDLSKPFKPPAQRREFVVNR